MHEAGVRINRGGKTFMQKMILSSLVGLLALTTATPSPAGAQERRSDFSKMAVESPVKRLLSVPSPLSLERMPANRKMQPGLVHWRADLESACEAAKTSGKPVLLFQMMGNLNQEYC